MAGLFDIFSNKNAAAAADAQTAGINQGYGQLAGFSDQARGALGTNYGQAITSLTGNFGQGRSALTDATGQGLGALGTNYSQGLASLTGNFGEGINALTGTAAAGRDVLGTNYAAALAPVTQNFNTANAGTTALGNALGLNGAAGNKSATDAFWNNPAIQSQLDIGSQNVLRNQAATGQLASGKTNVDLQNLGQQIASQGWNNYVSQLSPYLNFSQGAASGIGGLYSGLGTQLAQNYGNLGAGVNQNLTGLGTQTNQTYGSLGTQTNQTLGNLGQNLNQNFGNVGTQAAGLYGNLGTQLAQSYGNQGNAAYGAQTSIGNANANAELANNTASANMWGAILGGAKAAAGAIPMLSDERAKEDIEPVGELRDGQIVFRYRYRGDPRTQIGLIAQDVENVVPDAVVEMPGLGGLKGVDYRKATDFSAALLKMAA